MMILTLPYILTVSSEDTWNPENNFYTLIKSCLCFSNVMENLCSVQTSLSKCGSFDWVLFEVLSVHINIIKLSGWEGGSGWETHVHP